MASERWSMLSPRSGAAGTDWAPGAMSAIATGSSVDGRVVVGWPEGRAQRTDHRLRLWRLLRPGDAG